MKSPIASRNDCGACNCGRARNRRGSSAGIRQQRRQFARHRRRRRLVMFADQHQHGHLDPRQLRPEVEFGQRRTGGLKDLRIGVQNASRRSPIRSGCCAWNSGANSRRIATSVMPKAPWLSTPPPCCERLPAFSENAARNRPARAGWRCPDGESPSATRRSRHNHCRARSPRRCRPRPSPPPPSGRKSRQDHRRRLSSRQNRQLRHDHPERPRQFGTMASKLAGPTATNETAECRAVAGLKTGLRALTVPLAKSRSMAASFARGCREPASEASPGRKLS